MSEVQSSAISKIKSLWKRLGDRDYRDAFTTFKVDDELSAQIFALREQQGLTQEELGDRAGMAQSRIAKLEGTCSGVSLATIKRLANAFDVGLSVRFVPFSEIVAGAVRDNLDRYIPPFPADHAPSDNYVVKIEPSRDRTYLPSVRASGTREMFRSPQISNGRNHFRDTLNA